jgi:hypothetical protein
MALAGGSFVQMSNQQRYRTSNGYQLPRGHFQPYEDANNCGGTDHLNMLPCNSHTQCFTNKPDST